MLFAAKLLITAMMLSGNIQAHGLASDRLELASHSIAQLPVTASVQDKARLLLARGRIHQQNQNWLQALSDYRQALSLSPLLYEVYYWQGVLHTQKSDFKKAQRRLEAYLRRVPESPNGHIAMAELKHLQADYYYAAAHYDLAIQHEPNAAPDIFLQRAKNLQYIKPVPLMRIENGLREGYAVHGAVISLVSTLITAKVHAEDYHGALDEFAYLPAKVRTTAKWQIQEAELLDLVGDKLKAMERYQAALKAIDSLPSHRRLTSAMVELREQAQREITYLTKI